MDEALLLLFSYLLGSVPFAFLLGRARGVDIRGVGSGNIGATNLGRALGRRWAVGAFLLDFLKGTVPVLVARFGPLQRTPAAAETLALGCAAAAIAGHVAPVWLRFRGGKGVATTFGAMTALAPIAAVCAGIVWLLVYAPTRVVSVASLAASLALPAGVTLSRWGDPLAQWLPLLAFSLVVTGLIVLRHRTNIARLLRGEEPGFGRGARAPSPQEDAGKAPGDASTAGDGHAARRERSPDGTGSSP